MLPLHTVDEEPVKFEGENSSKEQNLAVTFFTKGSKHSLLHGYSTDSLDGMMDGFSYNVNTEDNIAFSDDDITVRGTQSKNSPAIIQPLLGRLPTDVDLESGRRSWQMEDDTFSLALQRLGMSSSRNRVTRMLVGFLFIVVIPIFWLFCVKARESTIGLELRFRSLVTTMEVSFGLLGFWFIHLKTFKFGLNGLLFSDQINKEHPEFVYEYRKSVKKSSQFLFWLFFPVFVVHVVQKVRLFVEVPFELSFVEVPKKFSIPVSVAIGIMTSISWVVEMLSFFMVCTIFWRVTKYQVMKMALFKDKWIPAKDPAVCFKEYKTILDTMNDMSLRFRLFLSLTGFVAVLGGLSSMYEVVSVRDYALSFVNFGDVIVINCVAFLGVIVLVRSASKISHLHKKVVARASERNAEVSYSEPPLVPDLSLFQDLRQFGARNEAWHQRDALVTFLENSKGGISLYGFILDRTFVHATLGMLLTTTWFILGRSLSVTLPAPSEVIDLLLRRKD